jgi:cytochrome c oxidase cbb3-type subunit 3
MMEQRIDEMTGHNRIPRGYLVLFFGLIAWGLFYIAAYTPGISGWSQYGRLAAEQEAGARKAAAPLAENPYENDPKAVAEGQVLYAESCAGCHGKDIKGGIGADLTGHLSYGETDGDKFESISAGRPGGMPGFSSQLGREKIWKVLAYVDSIRERKR